jgi:hypothetical protein
MPFSGREAVMCQGVEVGSGVQFMTGVRKSKSHFMFAS